MFWVFRILLAICVVVHGDVLNDAIKLFTEHNDVARAIEMIQQILHKNPQDIEAMQILGSIYWSSGDTEKGAETMERAMRLDNFGNPVLVSNYVEVLKMKGQVQEAVAIGEKGLSKHPNDSRLLINLANAYMAAGRKMDASRLYNHAIDKHPTLLIAYKQQIDLLLSLNRIDDAESVVLRGQHVFGRSADFVFFSGLIKHHRTEMEEALALYKEAYELDPNYHVAVGNMAAIHHVKGGTELALKMYTEILPHFQDDAGFLNNYGAILGTMHQHEEEIVFLTRSYELQPKNEEVTSNLASYYQDEGDLALADRFLRESAELSSQSSSLLTLRRAILLSPVSASWRAMLMERHAVQCQLIQLLSRLNRAGDQDAGVLVPQHLDGTLDRVMFYMVYHGLNDRFMQTLVTECYRRLLLDFNEFHASHVPQLLPFDAFQRRSASPQSSGQPRKIRVGFMSKFLGIFEPHGMLLDGVMKYLPRDIFEVVVLAIARGDGKPLSSTIAESVSEIYEVPLSHVLALNLCRTLSIDVMVFADTMSEPLTHFLAHFRLAPVQVGANDARRHASYMLMRRVGGVLGKSRDLWFAARGLLCIGGCDGASLPHAHASAGRAL